MMHVFDLPPLKGSSSVFCFPVLQVSRICRKTLEQSEGEQRTRACPPSLPTLGFCTMAAAWSVFSPLLTLLLETCNCPKRGPTTCGPGGARSTGASCFLRRCSAPWACLQLESMRQVAPHSRQTCAICQPMRRQPCLISNWFT